MPILLLDDVPQECLLLNVRERQMLSSARTSLKCLLCLSVISHTISVMRESRWMGRNGARLVLNRLEYPPPGCYGHQLGELPLIAQDIALLGTLENPHLPKTQQLCNILSTRCLGDRNVPLGSREGCKRLLIYRTFSGPHNDKW